MKSRPDIASKAATPLFVSSLLANVFSGNFDELGLPLPMDRILFVLALLALAYRGALSSSVQWRPVHVVLVLSVAWATASAAWAETLWTSSGFFALVDRVAMPALLFVVAPHFLATPGSRRLFMKAMTVTGLYLGLVSVFSVLGPHVLVYPRYIMDPDVGIAFGRARGPFVQSSANGLGMAYCALLAAAGMKFFSPLWRSVAWAAICLCMVGSLLTYTRSIWLGVVVGALAFCWVQPHLRRFLPVVIGGATVAVAVLVTVVPAVNQAVFGRIGNQRSIDDRTTTYDAALRAVEQNPLTGVGWGKFLSVVEGYVRQQDLVPLTNVQIEAHNVFLSRAAELGIPGALLWLATTSMTLGFACLYFSRHSDLEQWRVALIGIFPVFLCVAMLTPLANPFSNAIPFVVAGVVLRGYQVSAGASAGDRRPRPVDASATRQGAQAPAAASWQG